MAEKHLVAVRLGNHYIAAPAKGVAMAHVRGAGTIYVDDIEALKWLRDFIDQAVKEAERVGA